MKKDPRQIRATKYGNGLFGYRARKDGRSCFALMHGKGQELTSDWKCIGVIFPEDLISMLNEGPYLDLDDENCKMNN